METAKFTSHHHEHTKQLLRVLNFRQERRVETKTQCNFGGLVEVCFLHVVIEGEKGFKDHEFVGVGHCFLDAQQKFIIGQWALCLQALIG